MAATVAAQIAALVEVVNALKERADEDRRERKEYHADLSEALEEDRKSAEAYRAAVQADLQKLTSGQTSLIERVEHIEPITRMINSLHMRITGGLIVIGFIGAVAWGGVVFFKEHIIKWLGG